MAHKRSPGLFFESDRSQARILDPKKNYREGVKKVEQKKVKIIKKQEKTR